MSALPDLFGSVLSLLLPHCCQLNAPNEDYGIVFATTTGTPINPSNHTNRSFKPLLKRAGLPDIRFHDLRHTFASLMMPNVQNPQIVQEMLGHSRISTTLDIYSHLSQDVQEEAVGRFGALFPLGESSTQS